MKEIIGTCSDYTHDGKGVIIDNGIPIFVDYLIIGEEAKIKITKVLKNYMFGSVIEIIKPSMFRTKSLCNVFKQCGGCQLMHLSYEGQLDFKKRQVENALRKIAELDVAVEDVIAMENPLFYRNKVQIPIGMNREGELIAGFYQINSHKVISFNKCYLQQEISNIVIKRIINILRTFNYQPYDELTNRGEIRHLFLRTSESSGEVLLVIVVTALMKNYQQLVDTIRKENPEITSLIFNINPARTNVILGNENKIVYGSGKITEELNGLKFNISANSFYQVNSRQVHRLYQKALELGNFNKDDTILDAYSGIGVIGLILASNVKKVISVEIVQEAIEDAKENAKINNIENIEFILADAAKIGDKLKEKNITGMIIDPPRKGCSNEFLDTIIAIKPAKLVYISCNPATLARDLKTLKEYYKIEKVVPVDMFPFTYHIETIVMLFPR